MVSNPCSILNFEVNILKITLFFALWSSLFSQEDHHAIRLKRRNTYFQGLAFLLKTESLTVIIMRKNGLKTHSLTKKGDTGKALSLYEKFSQRRSDAVVVIDSKKIKVGPESLLQAAKIREEKGDWSKSFSHLKLIKSIYRL